MPSNNFKVGEMLNKRTPNTKTWMNFDGSHTTEIHSGVVHFDDGLNNLHNINTSLFDEADADSYEGPTSKHGKNMLKHEKEKVKDKKKQGKMNRDDFDYQVPTLPFSIQIPKNIKKGYSIGQNDEFVRFIPQNVSPSKGYVNKAKNNEIQYQDAWNDTDIVLEVTDQGIKETMILKTDRAPFAFSFEIDGVIEDDLTMGNMKLEPAWLIDAVGEKRDVSQTIRREGETTYIDLVADVEGLVYPIEIDPTVSIGPVPALWKDAWVQSAFPTNNYDDTVIRTGKSTTSTFRSFIEFDLSGVPSGVEITTAIFSMYNYVSATTISRLIGVCKNTTSWEEGAVTFNTMPSYDVSTKVEIPVTNTSWCNWEIKNMVSEWVNNQSPNYGLTLIGENVDNSYKYFYSSESTDTTLRPKISITYNQPPTPPTVTTPNGGETWNSSHTVEWESGLDSDFISLGINSNGVNTPLDTQYTKRGQKFLAKSNSLLQGFKYVISSSSTGYSFNICVYECDVDGLPSILLLTDNVLQQNISTATILEHTFSSSISLIGGKKYAIILEYVDNPLYFQYTNPDNYPDGNMVTFEGSWINNIDTISMRCEVLIYNNSLQHQIQLSTDNGVNWSDIVALTSAGATQYIHDFINAPQTSTAKIRIRAFDGSAYGPWDESDGVFSIIHNLAPNAPTNLTPVTTKDRAGIIRFVWQHNDPNADAQSKFDLDYRLQGSTTWNTVTQNTINQFYDLPAGSLPRGTIEWRVRTYDQADLSGPYSELKTFFAGDKPSKPTTVSPVDGSIVSVSNPTVQWSSVGQVGYNLKVLDVTETEVLWETNQTSNNKAHTVGYSLENETDYVIQLSIKNVDGINSNVEESNIHVSYTPPAIPTLSITGEGNLSTISISIENPIPVNTEPVVTHHDLFRRKVGDSKWTRIADNVALNGSYIDFTPASEQVYEYYVRAWGDNGTYRDSAVVNESITLKSIWLVDPDELESIHHFRYFEPGRTSDRVVRGQMMEFEGRSLGMAEFSSKEQQKVNVVLQLKKNSGDLEALHDLLSRHSAILYRDAKGRRIYGVIFSLSENETDYGYTVPIEVQAVSYEEGV